MAVRLLITLTCPKCNKERTVRKDGAGNLCSPCRARENHKKRQYIDISDKIFGKLKVLRLSHKDKTFRWICACECGNEAIVCGSRLRSGNTKSCGCIVSLQKKLSTSPSYRSWRAMIDRCYNPKNNRYSIYGGRGIKVSDSWKDSFLNFFNDMGHRPNKMSLDRIDNSLDYSKDNCRWATNIEQGNNRRNNLVIEHNGLRLTMTEWSRKTGIPVSRIRKRIIDLGWKIEDALNDHRKANKNK